MVDYTKINKYFLLTLLLSVFHIVSNIIWIFFNNVPLTWDAALHTGLSIKIYDYLVNTNNFTLVDFLKISEYYPPLVHLFGSILVFLGNDQYKYVALTGSLFFAASIIILYLYAKNVFLNNRLGFFAAFLYSFFLTNFQQSRDHMLDIPLTAFMFTAFLCLMLSAHFQRRLYSLLFFLFLAFSILTKWTILIYIIIPLFLELLVIVKKGLLRRDTLNTIVAGILVIGVLCLPWYLVNLDRYLSIGQAAVIPEIANPQNLFSIESLIFYLKLIINFQINFAGFILFLFSLILMFKHKTKGLLIFLLVISNYLFFTLILTKNVRYTIPMMPFWAIIMAYGLNHLISIKNIFINFLVLFIMLYYLFSYMVLSFGFPFYPNINWSIKLPVLGYNDLIYLNHRPVKAVFDKQKWPNEEILRDIINTSENKDRIVLLNLSDRGYINTYNLNPILYHDLPDKAINIQISFVPFLRKYITDSDIKSFLYKEIDYALVPNNYIGLPEAIKEYDHLLRFQKYFVTRKVTGFKLIKLYKVYGDYFHPELFPEDELSLFKKQTP